MMTTTEGTPSDQQAHQSWFASFVNPVRIDDSMPPTAEKREIFAWYMYDFANGAFFWALMPILGILIIEQASEYRKDQLCAPEFIVGTPSYQTCYETTWAEDYENEGTCVTRSLVDKDKYSTNTTCVLAGEEWVADWNPESSRVSLFGVSVGVKSVGQACGFISVFVQLMLFLFFGGVADYGGLRKGMLIGSTLIGASFTAMIWAGKNFSSYEYTGMCLIASNLFMGFAVIFYTAYLPLLVNSTPEMEALLERDGVSEAEVLSLSGRITSKLSLKGFSVGFLGGFLALVVFLIVLTLPFGGTCSSVVLKYDGTFAWDFHPSPAFRIPMRSAFAQVANLDLASSGSSEQAIVDKATPVNSKCGPSNQEACSEGILVFISCAIDSKSLDAGTLAKQVRDVLLAAADPNVTAAELGPPAGEDAVELTGVTLGEGAEVCSTEGVRTIAVLTSVWTVVFASITFHFLRARPGPPLPSGKHYYSVGIANMLHTMSTWRQNKQLFLFLGAYFIFSDGVSTATGAAAQFGASELNMSDAEIFYLLLEVIASCALMCAAFIYLEEKFDWLTPKRILLFNLTVMGCCCIYAMIALTSKPEFFIMGAIFGAMMGSAGAFQRTIFSSMVPAGQEAE